MSDVIYKTAKNPVLVYNSTGVNRYDVIEIDAGGERLLYMGRWNSGRLTPLKPIELITCIATGLKPVVEPPHYDSITLIKKNYAENGLDLISAYMDHFPDGYCILYEGYWNDGIIL